MYHFVNFRAHNNTLKSTFSINTINSIIASLACSDLLMACTWPVLQGVQHTLDITDEI